MIEFRPATEADIRRFVAWRYDPPFDTNDITQDPDEAVQYFLTADCHIIETSGDLIGFCTFGDDARVPGGDYPSDGTDVGMGVRPDLTGQGNGRTYVAAVIEFAQRHHRATRLRVTIAAQNARALRVWMTNGFEESSRFDSVNTVLDTREFVILERLRPDPAFEAGMASLEAAYLQEDEPEKQSGFSGGRARWQRERAPLISAINSNGDFLDVGCANGLLAKDVMEWAGDLGYQIAPYGIDRGPKLISLAKERLPGYSANFCVADAWTWQPGRLWTYVYSLLDLTPEELTCAWVNRLFSWVAPGGRLIVASYGSASRQRAPEPVGEILSLCGLQVAGTNTGGDGPITRFAWVEKSRTA